jgi:hypothetical protein
VCERLPIERMDSVLEIGFGPGVVIGGEQKHRGSRGSTSRG